MKNSRGPTAAFLGVANLLVFGALLYAAILQERAPAFYYSSLQEDAYLEWATFWAFAAAAAVFFCAAWRQRRQLGRLPWFLAGVGLFCFVVAMEEISWGQRVLGYRPPAYFLENNFQQELNVHNVLATSLRKQLLKAAILAYGVLLPLAAAPKSLRRTLGRLGLSAPPLGLVPAFAASFWLYQTYPWKFSGEVVELMLAIGFLAAAIAEFARWSERPPRRGLRAAVPIAAAGLAVLALGVATQAATRWTVGDDSERVAAARQETRHLKTDLLSAARQTGEPATRCGVHKRVYSFVEKYDVRQLENGGFSRLAGRGMPQERATYFLDPWNSPYWIRDKCERRRGRREVFVYSFGPNRRRDSTDWEIRGDDIGAVVLSSDGG